MLVYSMLAGILKDNMRELFGNAYATIPTGSPPITPRLGIGFFL